MKGSVTMRYHIPVGTSNFLEIRKNNYYYIDKSGLINELVNNESTKVTLITRPRRFGKTLGMSMLSNFFDIRKDTKSLFDGLEISKNTKLCNNWMNQYPTIFISFRRVDGLTFESAYGMLCFTIEEIFLDHSYLLDSDKLSTYEKDTIRHILERKADALEIKNSLLSLTRFIMLHYNKPVILLIDEYDVPIAKANSNGYYKEMLDTMKGLMQVLKDNDALHLAVITGCLKIAKESIFTGTNNFVSDTIADSRLNEYFGFTQREVERIFTDMKQISHLEEAKMWYDGYHFGDFDIYCPWDIMNYLADLQNRPNLKPKSYWNNTSDNAIIRSFIDFAGKNITKKLEILLSGGSIIQQINDNLTYDYLHSSEDNLWSILYLTGYLTKVRDVDFSDNRIALTIPNEEVKQIFETTVMKWFTDHAKAYNRKVLFDSVWNKDSTTLTKEMSSLLRKTISYHDYREDFYHAFLAGIFTGAGYMVESGRIQSIRLSQQSSRSSQLDFDSLPCGNREHGEGRSDVIVYDEENARVAIFEAKYSKSLDNMEKDCDRALEQIDVKMYATEFEDDYDEILCYGISFFKKRCMVRLR